MMITDPISDMLTRIKNAYLARKDEVVFPYSKMKLSIVDILKDGGYIKNTEILGDKKREIKVSLLYKNNQSAMQEVKRISKPGRRVYAPAKELPNVKNGFGIAIISTPKGIMTVKEARKANVGGEIICEVY
ncbi:MAG: 30S ribosomal protein S8 [Patescibacteria group bacterium]